jgi:membrane-bound ClpP family serine protease
MRVKNLGYGTIVGRIGIILLLTGLIIALVSKFRHINRLSGSMVTYIWEGLIVVGAILSIVFVIDFVLKDRKHQQHLS